MSSWRRPTSTRPSSRGPRAGTSCPARRRGASSGSSTRNCRRWPPNARRALLVEHGGGTIAPGRTDAGAAPAPAAGAYATGAARPRRRRGVRARRHASAGCARWAAAWSSTRAPTVTASWSPPRPRGDRTSCSPRTWWRRCCGWRATTPSRPILPTGARPDAGSPRPSCVAAAVARALAETGYVEVLPFPFVGPRGVGRVRAARRRRPPPHRAGASTRWTPTGAALSTTLLPGLLDALRAQPVARVRRTSCCYTVEQVVLPHRDPVPMPDPDVDGPADGRRVRADQGGTAGPAGARGRGARRRPGAARLVGPGPPGPVGRRDRDRPARGRRGGRRAACHGGLAAALAPGPVRRAARRGLDRRPRRRAAPEGRRGARPPAPHVCRRDRPRRPAAARRPPRSAGVALPAGVRGRRARRRRRTSPPPS